MIKLNYKWMVLLLVIIIFTGCSNNDNTKIDDGLAFTLKIERDTVMLGDTVKMSFIITNLTNTTITLIFPTTAQAIFEIWNNLECVYCIPSVAGQAITQIIFFPQETKTYKAEWLQHNFDGQSVSQGNYCIIAYLDYYGNDTKLESPFIITE